MKACFVAMPITTPVELAPVYGDPDHFSHVLEFLFRPALATTGFEVISPTIGGFIDTRRVD